ncbi:hypothetical protein TruAng_008545 [Truncatella angustata]|nr:hypothetical protein TruAng_008545 [Truncatella angustata]
MEAWPGSSGNGEYTRRRQSSLPVYDMSEANRRNTSHDWQMTMPAPYPASPGPASQRLPEQPQPPPPTWPMPATDFPQFATLPTEIRHLIWEFYLAASPRIHVVHETGPAPLSAVPRRDEVLSYTVTSLDAATNIRCAPSIRTSHVNHECVAVATRLCGGGGDDDADDDDDDDDDSRSGNRAAARRFAAVRLARDLERSASGRTAADAAAAAAAAAERQNLLKLQGAQGRVAVEWSRDLLFICSPSNEQAFRNLAETSWASRIQRLAVLVPRRCDSNIPFGPGYIVSHTLRPMASLKEIYVVMIPFVRPAPDPTGPGNSWARDQYGFVNYVDYLKEVGITTQEMSQERHMTYQRTALSFMQALSKHLEVPGVVLKKVVDVDCRLFTESAYARKERWRGIQPADNIESC